MDRRKKKRGAAVGRAPSAVRERSDYGFFAGAFIEESGLAAAFFIADVSVIFMPVSAAGAAAGAAAAGAAAAGAASLVSPEQAASTSAAATKAIFFMAKSPYEYWIGTIETAPYTQSSDST
jgi:hypothetical protein